jgi:hypothetical protein
MLSLVNFGINDIGINGGTALANSLVDKISLSYIDFSGGSIGDGGGLALSTALQDKSKLSTVLLGNNAIHDDAMVALAETLAVAPALNTVDLMFNPMSVETEARVQGLLSHVAKLSVEAYEPSNGCLHLCPSKVLQSPNAVFSPTGKTCLEQASFCAESDKNCDPCVILQFESLKDTDCCGSRTPCNVECPVGLNFEPGALFTLPGLGEFTCAVAAAMMPTGAAPMPCDELTLYMARNTPCCQ